MRPHLWQASALALLFALCVLAAPVVLTKFGALWGLLAAAGAILTLVLGRAADAAIVRFIRLMAWMPWIAAVVIGTCLTWFNVVLLRHPWWLSLLYGFSVPLLLASGFHRMYRGADGARSEAGCACGLLPLILFLILLPLFVRATKKAMAGTGHAVSSGPVTQKQSR